MARPEPLPAAWRRRFGLRTHRILVSFPAGKLRVQDQR